MSNGNYYNQGNRVQFGKIIAWTNHGVQGGTISLWFNDNRDQMRSGGFGTLMDFWNFCQHIGIGQNDQISIKVKPGKPKTSQQSPDYVLQFTKFVPKEERSQPQSQNATWAGGFPPSQNSPFPGQGGGYGGHPSNPPANPTFAPQWGAPPPTPAPGQWPTPAGAATQPGQWTPPAGTVPPQGQWGPPAGAAPVPAPAPAVPANPSPAQPSTNFPPVEIEDYSFNEDDPF